MTRTTISLPPELLRKVKVKAAEKGISMAELIREKMEEAVTDSYPRPRSIGIVDIDETDLGRKAGDTDFVPRPWRSS